MLGAARDGAELFLAPADNCPEVRGNVPEGLRAVRVATLSEALEALVAMRAGRTDSLATCG
jgi:PDZ domain-containing protein